MEYRRGQFNLSLKNWSAGSQSGKRISGKKDNSLAKD